MERQEMAARGEVEQLLGREGGVVEAHAREGSSPGGMTSKARCTELDGGGGRNSRGARATLSRGKLARTLGHLRSG
jgi:hypothetical protein